jgi:hypothetical protein
LSTCTCGVDLFERRHEALASRRVHDRDVVGRRPQLRVAFHRLHDVHVEHRRQLLDGGRVVRPKHEVLIVNLCLVLDGSDSRSSLTLGRAPPALRGTDERRMNRRRDTINSHASIAPFSSNVLTRRRPLTSRESSRRGGRRARFTIACVQHFFFNRSVSFHSASVASHPVL